MIGRLIYVFQRRTGFPTTLDIIDELMMKYEAPVLVDGPAEIALPANRVPLIADRLGGAIRLRDGIYGG